MVRVATSADIDFFLVETKPHCDYYYYPCNQLNQTNSLIQVSVLENYRKNPKTSDTIKIAVIIQKFEQWGFTMQ